MQAAVYTGSKHTCLLAVECVSELSCMTLTLRQRLPTAANAKQSVSCDMTSQAVQSRQPCVNSHWLSQWELVIFEHPQNQRPLTDR